MKLVTSVFCLVASLAMVSAQDPWGSEAAFDPSCYPLPIQEGCPEWHWYNTRFQNNCEEWDWDFENPNKPTHLRYDGSNQWAEAGVQQDPTFNLYLVMEGWFNDDDGNSEDGEGPIDGRAAPVSREAYDNFGDRSAKIAWTNICEHDPSEEPLTATCVNEVWLSTVDHSYNSVQGNLTRTQGCGAVDIGDNKMHVIVHESHTAQADIVITSHFAFGPGADGNGREFSAHRVETDVVIANWTYADGNNVLSTRVALLSNQEDSNYDSEPLNENVFPCRAPFDRDPPVLDNGPFGSISTAVKSFFGRQLTQDDDARSLSTLCTWNNNPHYLYRMALNPTYEANQSGNETAVFFSPWTNNDLDNDDWRQEYTEFYAGSIYATFSDANGSDHISWGFNIGMAADASAMVPSMILLAACLILSVFAL